MFIEAMRLSCHTPKFIKNGPYDAVLVHNYWPSAVKHPMVVDTEGELITRGGPDTLRGGMRNKFVTHAAALMYKHGETKCIVIAGAPIKGPGLPSGAQITKDALVRIHHIPEEAITIREDGFGTDTEVSSFMKVCEEQNWKKVATLAFDTHKRSAEPFLSDQKLPGMKAEFLPLEGVIYRHGDRRLQRLLYRFVHSRYEWAFKAYEEFKALVRKVPSLSKQMYETNQKIRENGTSIANELVMHMIDKVRS